MRSRSGIFTPPVTGYYTLGISTDDGGAETATRLTWAGPPGGVVLRLGRLLPDAKGAGINLVFWPIETLYRINMRLETLDVPPQDIITRDNVSVKLNAVCYFRVVDANMAMSQVQNYQYATSPLAQTTLHSIVGQFDLDEILSQRDKVNGKLPGDTIEIPPGDYLGPIELKDHVNVVGKIPSEVKLRSDPTVANDSGIAIAARGVRHARIEGLRILADDTHPLRTGVAISNSSLEVADVDISGAIESGIRIDGPSEPILLGNFIHANSGPGVIIKKGSAPRLISDWIVDNGKVAHELRPGIEVEADARPQFSNNVIAKNGVAESLSGDAFSEKTVSEKNK